MTLLNAFFYLMMILSGAAVAIILHDLKRAEDRALESLIRLQTQNGRTKMSHNRYKNISSESLRCARDMRQCAALSTTGNLSSGFLTIADGLAQTDRIDACQVQFDFATSRTAKKREQTVSGLPTHSEQSDCCA